VRRSKKGAIQGVATHRDFPKNYINADILIIKRAVFLMLASFDNTFLALSHTP